MIEVFLSYTKNKNNYIVWYLICQIYICYNNNNLKAVLMNFDLEAIIVEKLVGNAIFGQSGGPTAVINSSAAGVIITALQQKVSLRKRWCSPRYRRYVE